MTKRTAETIRSATATSPSIAMAICLALVALGAFAPVSSAVGFNNVQVFVTTSSNLPYSFIFSAYNLTGYLVGSYQSAFPAAGFELPTGDYLFTVSATYQNYVCYSCFQGGVSTPPSDVNRTESTSPIRYNQPSAEYGYAMVHVSSAETLQISTLNVTSTPSTEVSVRVVYANGTAASGSSVSASIVGEWYYWWGPDTKMSMWAQTDINGMATLVLPRAPAVVTAWSWLPVNVPSNQSTVVANVGGEAINVTVYWQQTYVGLSASGMLLPPEASISLTLHYQKPDYWVMPMGVDTKGAPATGGGNVTLANQPTGVPSQATTQSGQQGGNVQYYIPGQIPALDQFASVGQTSSQSGMFGIPLAFIEVAGLSSVLTAAVLLSIVYIARRRTRVSHTSQV